jgi:hypothetical protein
MTAHTLAQRQAWMAQWRSAAIELARIGQRELEHADLWRAAAELDEACIAAAQAASLGPQTTGLIEQQRWWHGRARE